MNRVYGYQGKATPDGWEQIQTKYLATADYPHHEAHKGQAYFMPYSALADNTDTIEVRIETTDSYARAHMVLHIESALASTAELWVGTTKLDVPGNVLVPMNRDMDSSSISDLIVCHTPGGAQAGTADLTRYIGSASASGKADVGGTGGSRGEFILPRSTAILVKMTSRADSNALTIVLDYYHHDTRND